MATKVKLIADGVITPDQITLTTASTGTNTTAPATTAFVQQEISALVDSSPEALNTLNELAAALGDDANFSTTVTNSIALKAPLASPTLTGTVTVDTDANSKFTIADGGADAITLYGGSGDELYIGANAAYKLRFKTDGNIVMDNGGSFGIGTDNPKTTLNVAANNSGQGPILTLENTDTSITTNDVLGQIDFYGNDGSTGGTGQKATIQAIAQNSSGTSVGLIFGTSPFPNTTATERMRIDSSGNIQIGTSNPSGNKSITIQAGTDSSASLRLKNDAHDWDVNCQTNDNFAIYSHTDTTERLIINPSTEITLKPNNGTVIVDGGTADYEPAKVELQGRAFGGDITAKYEVSDGGAVFFGSTTNHSVRFIANNTEKLRIESSQILLNAGSQTYSNNQRLQAGSEAITWSSSTSAQNWTSSNNLPYQKFVEAALHFGYSGNGAISQHFYLSLMNHYTGLSIQTTHSASGNNGNSYHTITFTSTGAYNSRKLVVVNTPASGQNTANLNGTIYYGFAR